MDTSDSAELMSVNLAMNPSWREKKGPSGRPDARRFSFERMMPNCVHKRSETATATDKVEGLHAW